MRCSITAGLLIGWLTAMVIKPPKELKMHVIVATGLGGLTAAAKAAAKSACTESPITCPQASVELLLRRSSLPITNWHVGLNFACGLHKASPAQWMSHEARQWQGHVLTCAFRQNYPSNFKKQHHVILCFQYIVMCCGRGPVATLVTHICIFICHPVTMNIVDFGRTTIA